MEIVFENDGAEHLEALLKQDGVTETAAGVWVEPAGYPAVRRLLQDAEGGGWVLGVKFQNGQEIDGVVTEFSLAGFDLQPVTDDGRPAGLPIETYLTAIDRLWVF